MEQSQEPQPTQAQTSPALCPDCGSKAVKVRGFTDNGQGQVFKMYCESCMQKWTAATPNLPDESDGDGEL